METTEGIVAASAARAAGPASTDKRIAIPLVACSVTSAQAIEQATVAPITLGRVPIEGGMIPLAGADPDGLATMATGLFLHNLIDGRSAQALIVQDQGVKDAFDTHVHYQPTMNPAEALELANVAWNTIKSDDHLSVGNPGRWSPCLDGS